MVTVVDDKEILKLLLRESYISREDAKKAWEASKVEHTTAVNYLRRHDLLSKDVLGMAIAESYGVPFADFEKKQVSEKETSILPPDVAQQFRLVVFQAVDDKISLATDQPTEPSVKEAITKQFPNTQVEIRYALSEEIDEMLLRYKKNLGTRFSEIIKSGDKIAPTIIDTVIADAVATHASDVHFEPEIDSVIVRLRVDGVLQEAGSIDKNFYQTILNRIKVMAHLRIDEHGAVQDGAIRYDSKETGPVDMRVSIAPTISGEKIVIRLLTAHTADFTLNDLGLSASDQKLIELAGKKPFGMVVVTGPTGSGKTTTLYSLMKFIKNPNINITTIEDPVEYKIPGVAQIQVNPDTHLTFGEGLRSIVRQDPDVILVGEVRDLETAEIAVNAALTGHLMLTTFHANDAATAIPRLLELGTEPFLLASTLEIVVAQRLLRRICQSCRVSTELDLKAMSNKLGMNKSSLSSLENIIKQNEKGSFYTSKGCAVCKNTGYKGRVGIFEIIPLDDSIKELILKKPSRNEIWEQARKLNAKTLFEDGFEKVKSGMTSMEELLRVVPIPVVKAEAEVDEKERD